MATKTAEPCEKERARLKRRVEIETLSTAAQLILEISPEAARVLRDASRKLLAEHIKEIKSSLKV